MEEKERESGCGAMEEGVEGQRSHEIIYRSH
jgi:hypothetical protein